MLHIRGLFVLCAAALLAGAISSGRADTTAEPVDAELVLAADGSGSIDDDEFRTQREGYARAITHPDVLAAIQSGVVGRIALAYVEWGGPASQHTIVDWMVIHDAASARAFAEKLVAAPRAARGYNSISGAIDYAAEMIDGNAYAGLKKVIDVSGDGPNIGGRPVQFARDDAVRAGITINALVVQRPGGGYLGPSGEPLAEHYENDVIGGPSAFVVTVQSRSEFALAVRRKLILEIAQVARQR